MVDSKKIFDEFDSDKRGYLNRKEIPDAVRCCGLNPSEEDILKAFRVANCTTTKVQESQFQLIVKELRKTSLPDENRLSKVKIFHFRNFGKNADYFETEE
ncbi:unnamed protein product [Oikopleura dioica]|uniref:EF-hand domain-containing protein n=1 Tax=Oikopleura dioica TaxID=34765 RepID=E4XLN5_OIKDI|nr:unnamed protein product [Oikopleura dioica]